MGQHGSGLKILNVHSRPTFVRSAVLEIPITTKIIDAIIPYFPKSCICIAGYLDTSDQFWKVNYHWDLLVSKIDEVLSMPKVSDHLKKCALAIKLKLITNPPSPRTGYKDDPRVGVTKDTSSHEQIQTRHKVMVQSKLDFESVIVKAGIVHKSTKLNPPQSEKLWWLSVAPVATPGTSLHGTGYALDILGDNFATKRISIALGASLSFNEASHVHVEWKDGVRLPK